ncbi:MAG: hypothetical protein JRI97_07905 [Deltaproteobacteria bacterium]|nr:hypothetical protein [Deltaproteobacteria bacterium]
MEIWQIILMGLAGAWAVVVLYRSLFRKDKCAECEMRKECACEPAECTACDQYKVEDPDGEDIGGRHGGQ